MLTPRALLLLLLAAPLIAAGTWFAPLQWLAVVVMVLCGIVFLLDRRLAGGVKRFEVERIHDNRLSLGAENPIRVTVYNRERTRVAFWVRDEAPEQFKISTRLLEGEVAPRQMWEGGYHVRPLRRGDYAFGNLVLRWRGPLGLVIRQGTVPAAAPVKVYPNLLDIRRYDLLLRQNRLQEMGLRHARMFGEGNEYERLREYSPDDEYRRINWKATARRNRPITVEYQTERSQNVFVVLDTGRMMQSPVADIAKLDYVINAALLLAYVATGKGDKIGMLTFADAIGSYVSPKQGRGQFYKMLELLYRVEPEPVEPNYRLALSYLSLKHRKRSLVVIFTDLSGGLGVDALISHVTALGRTSLPLVVTISDPDIFAAAHQTPDSSLSTYQRAAAVQLLEDRKLALDNLSRHGVLTLDVPANQLSLAVIDRYLALKGRGML
ncbi:MAG: DUF58 domain-containing protein [Anaerolineales bacterium]|nr:DUF58 domain-containing protein [Anaerolineales bacterium]